MAGSGKFQKNSGNGQLGPGGGNNTDCFLARVDTYSSSFGPASETPKRVHYWVVVVQYQNSG